IRALLASGSPSVATLPTNSTRRSVGFYDEAGAAHSNGRSRCVDFDRLRRELADLAGRVDGGALREVHREGVLGFLGLEEVVAHFHVGRLTHCDQRPVLE